MAVTNLDAWVPEEDSSEVIAQVQQLSAAESNLRKIPMSSDIINTPRIAGTTVAATAKGAAHPDASPTLDKVQLDAVKFSSYFQINWEDSEDSLANEVQAFQLEWAATYARLIDNAVFATTATTPNGLTVPYKSVYATSKGSGGLYTETEGALTYDNLSLALGKYEESLHFDESASFFVASPSIKAALRGIKDDEGRPIYVQAMREHEADTIFGIPVKWNSGLRTSATNTATPSGNPLLIVGNGNRGLFGDRSGIESQLSDEVGFMNDALTLKIRRRAAFAVAEPSAFSVLEITPE